MKKVFTLLSLVFTMSAASFAQTIVMCEDFSQYDSTTATANWHGFSLNYYSKFSYYTSTQSSGTSGPNSYKFGVDSVSMISPNILGADHIHFFMKGNASTGGSLANGAFYIYEGPDTINFTLIQMISPIPAGVSSTPEFALSPGTAFVKFFYDKDSGNVAFDDFCATIGSVGINEVSQSAAMSVFPNPTKGLTTIDFNNLNTKNGTLTINNVLGKEVKKIILKGSENSISVDFSEYQNGVYFVKVKSDAGEHTQRIVLRK